MAYYRLYFLNGRGNIEHFREFEAASDTAAVAKAAEWRASGAMELWSGCQKVRSWEAFAHSPEAHARSAVSTLRQAWCTFPTVGGESRQQGA